MISPLRGMKDIHFDEAARYEHIIATASEVARRYGFSLIETPILEETNLFKRSVGDSSDIVNKEMYQFFDKGEHDVCMRPEGTAGVVRAFISAKLDRQEGKNRFFYHGPMFRYERPQKGRLREFHQFGCESFGSAEVEEDFAIIAMVAQIFDTLGIEYELVLNSLGCKECMPAYKENLVAYLQGTKEQLCEDCNRRIETNPIRVLDCKNSNCQTLLEAAPKLSENLCHSCQEDFKRLQSLLSDANIDFKLDNHLVRGLDYYNKTAFEFTSKSIGSQSAIAGGGRYDKLVEYLDGKPTPAVGFALGIERILELVEPPKSEAKKYYIGILTPEALDLALKVAIRLRKTHAVAIEYGAKGFKSHMKGVDKHQATHAILIGEDELKAHALWHKDIKTKEEQTLEVEAFLGAVE